MRKWSHVIVAIAFAVGCGESTDASSSGGSSSGGTSSGGSSGSSGSSGTSGGGVTDGGGDQDGGADAGPTTPAQGLVFASDWSTATGTTVEAVQDRGKTPHWNSEACGIRNLLSVEPATGLGFPPGMQNVLRVGYDGENCADVITEDQWTAPANGEAIYFRLYLRMAFPSFPQGEPPLGPHHPIEPKPGICPTQWEFKLGPKNDGTFDLAYILDVPYPLNAFSVENGLSKDATYRLEWAFFRQSDGRYKTDIRVYDAANALVADAAKFKASDVPQSLAGSNPSFDISDECIRALLVGNNGPGSWEYVTPATNARMYYGGVAVGRNGWIGPYVAGEKVGP